MVESIGGRMSTPARRDVAVPPTVFDGLESRVCLSAGAALHGNVLTVTGGDAADVIAVAPRDHGATIRVSLNGVRSYFTAASISRIDIAAGRGSDSITLAETLATRASITGG